VSVRSCGECGVRPSLYLVPVIGGAFGQRAVEAAVIDARRAVAEFDGACQWLAAARPGPMEHTRGRGLGV
jgi:hypothetical protein